MFVYLVRNKWDGGIYQICATKEIAETISNRLSADTYIDEWVLTSSL